MSEKMKLLQYTIAVTVPADDLQKVQRLTEALSEVSDMEIKDVKVVKR